MFKLTIALLAVAAWGYTESPLWNDFNQLRDDFDHTQSAPVVMYKADSHNLLAINLTNTVSPDPNAAGDASTVTAPVAPAATAKNKETEEEEQGSNIFRYIRKNWSQLLLITLGTTGGFLVTRLIGTAVEGGPVLTYSLVLLGFAVLIALTVLADYLVERSGKKKEKQVASANGVDNLGLASA